MKNTKLIQLLKTFELHEINEFGKFVNSPFHNESTKLVNLYNFLKRFYPEFDDDILKKENIYKQLYGESKYDDKKLRDRFSDLLKLAEEYLAFSNMKKNPVDFKTHTLNEFSDRNLVIHFDKKYGEIKKIIQNTPVKDESLFYNEYQLSSIKTDFYESSLLLGKSGSHLDEVKLNILQFLRFFTAVMLRYYSVINNAKGFINYNGEYILFEPVIKFLNENNLEQYPLIKAFRLMLKLNKNHDDTESFYELKKLYKKCGSSLSLNDKIMITTELHNQANNRLIRGIPGFVKERFDIVKLQIEDETYPRHNGFMGREHFFSTIASAAAAGRMDWARKFIFEFSPKVVADQRENASLWAKGFLFYSDKKYDAALNELGKISTGDYISYLRVKVLTSQIYYDNVEFENLFSLIDSFKHYTASNKHIPEHLKRRYNNFMNMLFKLTLLNNNKDDYKVSKLTDELRELAEINSVPYQPWLLERAEKLRPGKNYRS